MAASYEHAPGQQDEQPTIGNSALEKNPASENGEYEARHEQRSEDRITLDEIAKQYPEYSQVLEEIKSKGGISITSGEKADFLRRLERTRGSEEKAELMGEMLASVKDSLDNGFHKKLLKVSSNDKISTKLSAW